MREKEKGGRTNSIKKPMMAAKQTPAKENDWIEEEIQEEEARAQKGKKVKDDISAMKKTMRGDNK